MVELFSASRPLRAAVLSCAALLLLGAPGGVLGNVHTIFLTECTEYFQWMSLGMAYSHKKSGQPGRVTRVMCCTDEQRAALDQRWIDEVPVATHFAPSYTHHPKNGDVYSAYNKPLAVIDFLDKNPDLEEDWILIVDADMLLRKPFIPEDYGILGEGWGVGAYYGYLKGVANKLADKHIPDVQPRTDREGGQPYGRKSDQVGGYVLLHVNDARRLAPDWLSFTEAVRFDPDAWELTGDVYAAKSPHSRPWISEMYGYSFAAAKADVWHKVDRTAMLYPTYVPSVPPKLLHYGLLMSSNGYSFDKHWHYHFDAFRCAPWRQDPHGKEGLFPHPPAPHELAEQKPGKERLGALLMLECINTLNEAFCERHAVVCTEEHEQMKTECARVEELGAAIEAAVKESEDAILAHADDIPPCREDDKRCAGWAESGECEANPGFMMNHCCDSCKREALRKKEKAAAKSVAEPVPSPSPPPPEKEEEVETTVEQVETTVEQVETTVEPSVDPTKVNDLPEHTEEEVDEESVDQDADPDAVNDLPEHTEEDDEEAIDQDADPDAAKAKRAQLQGMRNSDADPDALKHRCLALTLDAANEAACLEAASRGEKYVPAEKKAPAPVEPEVRAAKKSEEDPSDDPKEQLMEQAKLHAAAVPEDARKPEGEDERSGSGHHQLILGGAGSGVQEEDDVAGPRRASAPSGPWVVVFWVLVIIGLLLFAASRTRAMRRRKPGRRMD